MNFPDQLHSFPPIFQAVFVVALSACWFMLLVRFALGPTSLDRVTAMESLALTLISLVAVWGLILRTPWFMDAILVLSLVGFLSTVLVARYLERGRITDD